MAVSIRDAMLVYRTLGGNGLVLAVCEIVLWRSAFATRCWVTSEAAWDSRASNGEVSAGFSEAVVSGHFSGSLNMAARGWLQTLLGSAERSQCWLSVGLLCGGQHSRVGLLPSLHGTAALSMVRVSAGFL